VGASRAVVGARTAGQGDASGTPTALAAPPAATLGFIAANVAWLFALRAGVGIGKGFIVAAVLSGIGTVLLGVLVYHERISGPALIGVVLGIVAIAFLKFGTLLRPIHAQQTMPDFW